MTAHSVGESIEFLGALIPLSSNFTQAALFGAITVGFLVWTAIKQRRVPGVAQSRRATLRLRLICSARCG